MSIPKNKSIDEESVTVIVSRRVKSGREKEFENWAAGISRDAKEFEGYLGTKNIKPSSNDNSNSVVIIKFDSYKNLKKWEDSSIRAKWIEKAAYFTEGEVHVQKLTGLEYWFTLPKNPLQAPPPRFKMAVVTFLALFPTIHIVNLVLNPLLGSLQGEIFMAVSTLFTVFLMTYVIMPLMTRLFALWLFNK